MAKNGKYVLKICATGAKKAGSTAPWNTACKASFLVLTGGVASVSANSSGTYAGNVTTPVMASCSSSTFERTVTLVETSDGAITGKTNHGYPTTLTGTLPAFCVDTSTLAMLGEGTYQFDLTKR